MLQVSDDVSPVRCCLRLTGDVAGHELHVLTFQACARTDVSNAVAEAL